MIGDPCRTSNSCLKVAGLKPIITHLFLWGKISILWNWPFRKYVTGQFVYSFTSDVSLIYELPFAAIDTIVDFDRNCTTVPANLCSFIFISLVIFFSYFFLPVDICSYFCRDIFKICICYFLFWLLQFSWFSWLSF